MLPEPLQTIAHERLLDVFEHSITWEDDVWKADPLDVPEVHAQARRKFEDLLASMAQGRSPAHNRILLFHGHSGAGKTHLIRALRSGAHAAHRGYFGYAQMTPDVNNYAEYFLRRLVNSLEKPYDPRNPVETGLMRLSNHLVSRAGVLAPGARELLKESAVDSDKLSHLVARLADEIVAAPKFAGQDLDINIVRALLYLQRNDPRIDQRVRQYLYGRPVNEVGQPLVGALEALEGEDRPFEIIECLGRLMKAVDDATLVFCIDQVEDLRFFDNPEERFQKAIRDLIQIANRVTSSIVIISCLDDFYAATREYLPQSFIDRIEKAGPILLSEVRTEDEAREIVLKRMQAAFDTEGLSDQLPAFVEMVEAGFMRELAGLSTRRLLEHAQKRWKQLLGEEIEDEVIAPVKVAAVETADPAFAIKTQWDRHIHDSTVEIPSEENELIDILTAALRIAAEELRDEVAVDIAPVNGIEEVAAADLTVRQTGTEPYVTRMFLCNRSNQGGGLKRQLERVLSAGTGRAPVLIRASDFPPNANKSATAQLVRKFTNSGGRRSVIPTYEWERMLNVIGFYGHHRNEPGFEGWLTQAQPLSSLPSLRELLRLTTQSAVSHDEDEADDGPDDWSSNDNTPLPEVAAGPAYATIDPGDDGDEIVIPLGPPIDDSIDLTAIPEALPEPMPVRSEEVAPGSDIDAEADWSRFSIGGTLDQSASPVVLSKQILRRHAAMLGGSGSGKTTLALTVIEQLLLRGTPVVLIDRKGDLCSYANPDVWAPVAGESFERRMMREQLAQHTDVAVYTPGRTSGRPINITLLPNGIAELPSHEQQLLANVSAAAIGEMLHLKHSATHQRQSGILSVALKVLGSKSRSEVRLSDLIRLLEDDDEELVELTSRMDPSGKSRRDLMAQLDSLLHRNAALFDGHGESLRMESLLGLGQFSKPGRTRLSIIYTGFLGDNENVLFWVSQFLSEALRFCQRNPSEKLQAVIMFDEADLYIPAQSKPATKEPLESLLKRARSAGVGVMLATQSPGDLDYRSRDQITSWFIGRVREDTALKKLRAAFASESGLDPARVLPNQTVGEFHLIQEGNVRAMRSRRSMISAVQVPFDRIERLARETRKVEAQQLRLDLGDRG
ncbi:MAG: helicase HerA-like domain-containing protein [Hyphomicrobiaceae bacterium]